MHDGPSERQVQTRWRLFASVWRRDEVIAFVTEAPAVRQILAHSGEPTSPPPGPWPTACGRCRMPGRAASISNPSRHRITNAITASRGGSHGKTRPRRPS